MDIPTSTSDAMLDDDALEALDRTFAASGQARIPEAVDPDVTLAAGDCPWCSDYSGDWPGRHARKAHEQEWREYNDD